MPPKLITEESARELAAMLAWWRQRQGRTTGRPRQEEADPQAPEVYVARTPAGGIPALDEGTFVGTGTGSDVLDDVPGFADCDIYQPVETDGSVVLVPIGTSKRVYNLGTANIPGISWELVVRDKFGSWFVLLSSAPETAPNPTPTPTPTSGTALVKKGDPVPDTCLYEARVMAFYSRAGTGGAATGTGTGTGTGTATISSLCCYYEVSDAYLTLLDPADTGTFFPSFYSRPHTDGLPIYSGMASVPDQDICVFDDPCCPDDAMASSLCLTISNATCACINGSYTLPRGVGSWVAEVSFPCSDLRTDIPYGCTLLMEVKCFISPTGQVLTPAVYDLTIKAIAHWSIAPDTAISDPNRYADTPAMFTDKFSSACPTVRATGHISVTGSFGYVSGGSATTVNWGFVGCCGSDYTDGDGVLRPFDLDYEITDSPCPDSPIDQGTGTGTGNDCPKYTDFPNCCPDVCLPDSFTLTITSDDCNAVVGTFALTFDPLTGYGPWSSGDIDNGGVIVNFTFGCAGSSFTLQGTVDGTPFTPSVASSVNCDTLVISGTGTCIGGSGTFNWSIGGTPVPDVACCPGTDLPSTLTLTLSVGGSALGSQTLTWDGSAWSITGDLYPMCGITSLSFTCVSDSDFRLVVGGATTLDQTFTAVSCDPFDWEVTGVVASGSCGGPAIDITVTE